MTRITILLDVDNTLLDNDAAKSELDRRIRDHLGDPRADIFWQAYEAVRAETSVVSYPCTLANFWHESDSTASIETRSELADLVMEFPYAEFLYPGAMDAIAHLRQFGRVAILSDGDPAYQPSKIARAGIVQAVDGYVLVYGHKEEHLDEITAAFPADHYLLVEDKPENLTKVRAGLDGAPFTGILVRQGKYAGVAGADAAADITLDQVGDLCTLDLSDLLRQDRGHS
ncbi:MAG: HAD family hydrolase [Thermomicrobiales bacterium]